MKKFGYLLVILLSLLVVHPASANPGLLDEVKEITLSNGMRFLLLRRPGAPLFTAYIQVKVGGIDETDGQTGIAHLLEHMAFKGTSEIGTTDPAAEKKLLAEIEQVQAEWASAPASRKAALAKRRQELAAAASRYVVKEEFSQIYMRNGGSGLNATTSQDLTSYFVQLPNTKLKLWAFLESSRLRDPVFREFYSERDVVREERRSRVDDSPFGKLYEAMMGISFEQSPYRRPTIGYADDVEKLSATQLQEFYKKYYVPSNMVGAVVGDIDVAATEKILEEYFGKIPSGPKPPALTVKEPQPTAPKRVDVSFAASPMLMAAYLKPTMPHVDDYRFDVFVQVVCEGRTSRLYRRLVVQDRLVQNIGCSSGSPGSRLDNLFLVYASPLPGHSTEEVLAAVDDEFAKIARDGVDEAELKKAKKSLLADWNYEMQSNDEVAQMLSYFEAVTGSWRYIQDHPAKISGIGSADLQKIVATYLQPQRRRLAVLVPKS
jgi:predicted Zn-dependent peptidase